jgi:hypothetical protein
LRVFKNEFQFLQQGPPLKILPVHPPNYHRILQTFPNAKNPGVIFAYGDTIYAPGRTSLPPELVAHESVHGERQLAIGVENWWERYLTDPAFRYDEELLAHRAEYRKLCGIAPTRQVRRAGLKMIAKKLAAPLYGCMVTVARAMQDLEADEAMAT